jgi:hypothetical protein
MKKNIDNTMAKGKENKDKTWLTKHHTENKKLTQREQSTTG